MTFADLTENFYEDLNGRITCIRLVDEVFHFDFEFDHWSPERGRMCATLSCRDVVESTVSAGYLGGIAECDDDPLLWHHCESRDYLFFSSAASNPFEVLGRLYDVHYRLFGSYREPSEYFQTDPEKLQKSLGQLASGPRSAIAAYHMAAAPFMRCTIVPARERSAELRLVYFDDAYLICGSFEFTCRSDQA
jgi:hypothetical protein